MESGEWRVEWRCSVVRRLRTPSPASSAAVTLSQCQRCPVVHFLPVLAVGACCACSLSVVSSPAMSSVDARLLHEMWAGRLPVHFTLAPNEVTGLESPLPCVLLLPRYSYLPLCTDAVRRHLLPSAPAVEDEMWMEERDSGCPWRWHIPIGVLADISAAKQLSSRAYQPPLSSQSPSSLELPIRLTVHFQSFPSRRLLRCRSVQTVRQHLLHSIKEAQFVRRGDSKSVSAAAIAQHNKLWDSLLNGQDDVYQQVSSVMYGGGGGQQQHQYQQQQHVTQQSSADLPTFRLPIRVFLIGFLSDEVELLWRERESGQFELADMHYSPLQRPVNATEHTTLGSVLSELIGQREGAAGLLMEGELASVAVLVQGVSVQHDTPIDWLYRHCAHPDGFLYLTAVRLRTETVR